MAQKPTSVVAVDWGTSHLRIWPLDREGDVIDCHKSSEGMRSVERSEFEKVLERHLHDLEIDTSIPVIMCGMVGSRQGWCEAPYVNMPCKVEDVIHHAVVVPGLVRDVRILPGIANRSLKTPDVMRSEETQLLGLFDIIGDDLGGHIAMPGSHAKWVRFEKGVVIDFATGLTGELFAALGTSSVLKHALGHAANAVEPTSDVFLDAVRASLAEPATILTRLFSVRPHSLLHQMSDDDAAALISGTIIGQDIAGAMVRFSPMHTVSLVGSGHLGDLYQAALEATGLNVKIYSGDALAIAGLVRAARTIWPTRFSARQEQRGSQ